MSTQQDPTESESMKKQDSIFREILRQEGLRHTRQRQSIWEEIKHTDEHRDAEEIYLTLKQSGINVSRATVYRTIDVLVNHDLVRKLDLGDGRSRYEHKLNPEHHDHIVCLQCGKIFEFVNEKIETLQKEIAAEQGFTLESHIHQLFGRCDRYPDCEHNTAQSG